MKLKFISDECLMDLRSNFDAYKSHYYNQDHQWFEGYFSEEGRLIESSIPFEQPVMNLDEDFAISDMENVKVIYES